MQTLDRINYIKNWILDCCKSMPKEPETLVVGISGGIDSSVTSTICALTGKKTIVVLVKRKYSHPFFEKIITTSKKYHAHDEMNKFKIGDKVKIVESKPFSKKKRWEVINK